MTDLRYFDYEHLPLHLREVSKPFHDMAHEIMSQPGGSRTEKSRRLGSAS